MYINTYPELDEKSIWDSVKCAIDLFDLLATHLANKHRLDYPYETRENMISFAEKNYKTN